MERLATETAPGVIEHGRWRPGDRGRGTEEILLATRLTHGRRRFVEVTPSFPAECRYVLETRGEVYHHDALARERALSPQERLRFHQEQSGPLMERLHG